MSAREYLPSADERTETGGRPHKIRPSTFSTIIRDPRITSGAFRLWHLLVDMAMSQGHCWPGERHLAGLLKCSDRSLRPWRLALVAAGYLAVERITRCNNPAGTGRKHGGFLYRPLNLVKLPQKGVRFDTTQSRRHNSENEDSVLPLSPSGVSSLRSKEGKKGSLSEFGGGRPQRAERIGRSQALTEQIRAIRSQEAAWERRLSTGAYREIAWLETQAKEARGAKRKDLLDEIQRRKANPASWERSTTLKPEFKARVEALVKARDALTACRRVSRAA